MLQSLRDVIDGWQQARTFRHLTEILADSSDSDDVSGGAKLTKEEMLGVLEDADAFVEQYVLGVCNDFAFSVGAIMYDWLSPSYRRERPGWLARIQSKTEHHIV